MERLPSLNAVRYFEATARHQSFTAAAQELSVTPGAVSRMVQALEEELGAPLFTRNGRFIALTSVGVAYQKDVSVALGRISTASQRVRDSTTDEALSLIVNAGFATRWLVPRLSDFQRLHPKIHINILGGEADEKAYGHQAQLGIRYGVAPWPGSVATRLPIGRLLGVVCSPELAAASGSLQGPKDLIGKRLLAYTSGSRDPWQDYFSHFELPIHNLSTSRRFYQLLMVAEAANSGLGFALVPLFLFEAELASGRLVQAIPQTLESERGYYITHTKRADSDSKVLLFKKWLIAAARKSALQSATRSR
jgi:LysR family glycine cleavage system transcriptional activator